MITVVILNCLLVLRQVPFTDFVYAAGVDSRTENSISRIGGSRACLLCASFRQQVNSHTI